MLQQSVRELDDRQKYEAHQKFNYYEKQGLPNPLASCFAS